MRLGLTPGPTAVAASIDRVWRADRDLKREQKRNEAEVGAAVRKRDQLEKEIGFEVPDSAHDLPAPESDEEQKLAEKVAAARAAYEATIAATAEVVAAHKATETLRTALLDMLAYTRSPLVQTEEPIADTGFLVHFEGSEDEESPARASHVLRPFGGLLDLAAGGIELSHALNENREALVEGLRERRRRLVHNLRSLRHDAAYGHLPHLGAPIGDPTGSYHAPAGGFLSDADVLALTTAPDGQADPLVAPDFESRLLTNLLDHLTECAEGDPAGAGHFHMALRAAAGQEDARTLVLEHLQREVLYVEVRGHKQPGESARGPEGEEICEARARVLRSALLEGAEQLAPFLHVVAVGDAEPLESSSGDLVSSRRAALRVIERAFPGEHGFRVFPRHYKNIDHLLRRIPTNVTAGSSWSTVYDALIPTDSQALGMQSRVYSPKAADVAAHDGQGDIDALQAGRAHAGLAGLAPPAAQDAELYHFSPHVRLLRRRPNNIEELRQAMDEVFPESGVTPKDLAFEGLKVLRYLTSSALRRANAYEDDSWTDFIEMEGKDPWGEPRYSEGMKTQIKSAAQALLAYSAGTADAHSYGNFASQIVSDQLTDGSSVDRLLDGPTTEAWLRPWKRYLEQQGVRFFHGELVALELDPQEGEVRELMPVWKQEPVRDGLSLNPDAPSRRFIGYDPGRPGRSADFYVLALPWRPLNDVLKRVPEDEGDDFAKFKAFMGAVKPYCPDRFTTAESWMSGIQFFFESTVSLAEAHIYYPETTWGLSAISQTGFWKVRPDQDKGYQGVVSIDICDWHEPLSLDWLDPRSPPDLHSQRTALGSTPLEVALGTWMQLCWTGLPGKGQARGGAKAPPDDEAPRDAEGPKKPIGKATRFGSSRGPWPAAKRAEALGPKPVVALHVSTPTPANAKATERTWGRAPDRPPVPIPAVFHLDGNLRLSESHYDKVEPAHRAGQKRVLGNETPYLANGKGQFLLRPGLHRVTAEDQRKDDGSPGFEPIGDRDGQPIARNVVEYGVLFGRWVMAGCHMATWTRMMTMESACESGRHATIAILRRRDDHGRTENLMIDEGRSYGHDRRWRYNGTRLHQAIQVPEVADLEFDEIPTLMTLRRLDDRLFREGLPHAFDIVKAELRFDLAWRAMELARAQSELAWRWQKLAKVEVEVSRVDKLLAEAAKTVVSDWDFLDHQNRGSTADSISQAEEALSSLLRDLLKLGDKLQALAPKGQDA